MLTPTRYDIDLADGYVYTTTEYQGWWTVIRRHETAPPIPPCTEVLTSVGWERVLQQVEKARKFASAEDVEEFIEESI